MLSGSKSIPLSRRRFLNVMAVDNRDAVAAWLRLALMSFEFRLTRSNLITL